MKRSYETMAGEVGRPPLHYFLNNMHRLRVATLLGSSDLGLPALFNIHVASLRTSLFTTPADSDYTQLGSKEL